MDAATQRRSPSARVATARPRWCRPSCLDSNKLRGFVTSIRMSTRTATPAAGFPPAARTSDDSRASAASLDCARKKRGASWTKRTSGRNVRIILIKACGLSLRDRTFHDISRITSLTTPGHSPWSDRVMDESMVAHREVLKDTSLQVLYRQVYG